MVRQGSSICPFQVLVLEVVVSMFNISYSLNVSGQKPILKDIRNFDFCHFILCKYAFEEGSYIVCLPLEAVQKSL